MFILTLFTLTLQILRRCQGAEGTIQMEYLYRF